jgi:hypothetical protein
MLRARKTKGNSNRFSISGPLLQFPAISDTRWFTAVFSHTPGPYLAADDSIQNPFISTTMLLSHLPTLRFLTKILCAFP